MGRLSNKVQDNTKITERESEQPTKDHVYDVRDSGTAIDECSQMSRFLGYFMGSVRLESLCSYGHGGPRADFSTITLACGRYRTEFLVEFGFETRTLIRIQGTFQHTPPPTGST